MGTADNNNNLITYGNYGGAWVSFGVDTTDELYLFDICTCQKQRLPAQQSL